MELIGMVLAAAAAVAYFAVTAPPLTGDTTPLSGSPPKPPATTPLSIAQIINASAAKWGQDPELMRAIALKESNNNPAAINPSDPSYGLFQIQEFWLPYFGYARDKNLLFIPATAADVAAQILRYFRGRQNPQTGDTYRFPTEIDVYNVGETKWARGIRNVSYRDSVRSIYRSFGGKA